MQRTWSITRSRQSPKTHTPKRRTQYISRISVPGPRRKTLLRFQNNFQRVPYPWYRGEIRKSKWTAKKAQWGTYQTNRIPAKGLQFLTYLSLMWKQLLLLDENTTLFCCGLNVKILYFSGRLLHKMIHRRTLGECTVRISNTPTLFIFRHRTTRTKMIRTIFTIGRNIWSHRNVRMNRHPLTIITTRVYV